MERFIFQRDKQAKQKAVEHYVLLLHLFKPNNKYFQLSLNRGNYGSSAFRRFVTQL